MGDGEDRRYVIRSERVVTADGIEAAAVHVDGETIARVAPPGDVPRGVEVGDLGSSVVMPGCVDTHVHINEPGRTHWEGFETATSAAAAGGITTVVDMPLNSVPSTTTVDAFDQKLESASDQCRIDVGFWGGVVPGNAGDLRGLHERGALGFKCFRIDSGVEEFEHVGRRDLEEAMPLLAELESVLLTHAELPGPIERASATGSQNAYAAYLATRPPEAECRAIEEMVDLADEHGCRVHIVHLATAEALPALKGARADGVDVTVETCPHYLTFAAGEIPEGATEFKCAPPIRGEETRRRLWEALEGGEIDLVATDHSPSPPELKFPDGGGFSEAWGGIASLQLSLPAVWTEASARGIGLDRVVDWLARRPAQLAGIDDRKGTLEAGTDADLVVFDPDREWTVDADELAHRHPITPYDGERLRGAVERTYLRGECVYRDGEHTGGYPGRPVLHRRTE